jgi:hypothetical protein
MKAVIKQGIGCLDGELNPNAFEVVIYDEDGEELDVSIVNKIEIIGPIIGKFSMIGSSFCKSESCYGCNACLIIVRRAA